MMEDQLKEDLKKAQLSRDEVKVSTLRLLLSELNYAKIQKGKDLEHGDVVSVIQKEVKKRKEAALGFKQGGRLDSAQKEEQEASILESYLPEQLSDEELTKVVETSINELGAKSVQDMGRVIAVVRSKVGAGAEGGRISFFVKQKLT